MKYRLLLLILVQLGHPLLHAQSPFLSKPIKSGTSISIPKRSCFTVENEKLLKEKFPHRLAELAFEKQFQQQITKFKSQRIAEEEVFYIPTIVHVVHNGELLDSGLNISAEQVYSQFDVLNDDYRRLGAGYNDNEVGADIRVEFYPVTEDPEGQTLEEEGIDRVNGEASSWTQSDIESTLKPQTIWDPERYFNIWVLKIEKTGSSTILGYAQFPSLSGLDGLEADEGEAETDGIVIHYTAFGTMGTASSPYDGGRTTTHEVGHWLGLRHVWGDGGCGVDDYCGDTPLSGEANYECEKGTDTCTEDEGEDMIENYMDYTNDACMNIFTKDQKTRIRTVLSVCPRRYSLLGVLCSEAEAVAMGTNTSTPPQWYTYTADQDEVITVSSVGQTTENTLLKLYTECGSDYQINESDDVLSTEQSELSVFLSSGDSVRIYWSSTHSESTFNWILSTDTLEDAKVCDVAVLAQENTNDLPTTDLEFYWYAYETSLPNSKVTVAIEDRAYLYTGNCESLNEITNGIGDQKITGLVEGTTIYIRIEANGGGFSWTLNEEALESGEDCIVSVEAAEGINTTPSSPYWFTFDMPEYGDLTITTPGLSEDSTYVKLFDECGGEVLAEGTMDDSKEMTISLDQGAEIAILWDSIYNQLGFDWNITISPLDKGESCEVPATASLGTNNASGAPIWYTYTMNSSSGLLVSSEGLTDQDTYVYVYDACGGEVLSQNDDVDYDNAIYQSLTYVPDLEAGQTVYIFWSNANLEGDEGRFEWELKEQNNNTPTISDQTFTISSLSEDTLSIGRVLADDSDGDDLVFSITAGNRSRAFAIVPSTGELILYTAEWDSSINTELTVRVSDGISSNQATISIEEVILSTEVLPDIRIYPNPARDKCYIELNNHQMAGATLMDLTGKVVRNIGAKETEISITGLLPGIYLLKLELNDGYQIHKLVVK